MNKLRIETSGADVNKWRGKAVQLFRACERQRIKLGKRHLQLVRYFGGVRIKVRSTAYTAGNIAWITAEEGGYILYIGQYLPGGSPAHRVVTYAYDFDTNLEDTATEVIAYEGSTLPNSAAILFGPVEARLFEGSAYCIFFNSGGSQRIDMYKDNTLLATKDTTDLASDAGGVSGGAVFSNPGMLDDGRFTVTGYYTNPSFTIYTNIYGRDGAFVNTLLTDPSQEIRCVHQRPGGDIFTTIRETAPNDLYHTKLRIYDNAYTFLREVSLFSAMGMTAGSGAIQAMFQRGTNLYILSHDPSGTPTLGTQRVGVLDLTTDTYTSLYTRSSVRPSFTYRLEYYDAQCVYVDEAEENLWYGWLQDRTFTKDYKRVHLQKSGGTWSSMGEVSLIGDPDARAAFYSQ